MGYPGEHEEGVNRGRRKFQELREGMTVGLHLWAVALGGERGIRFVFHTISLEVENGCPDGPAIQF